ncbi:unnamed protein product [Amoebophrya sp. A120]|nr:unnamed protein product [Amoebophrya sp. A120]|eukprot:GSA120T00016047001.1
MRNLNYRNAKKRTASSALLTIEDDDRPDSKALPVRPNQINNAQSVVGTVTTNTAGAAFSNSAKNLCSFDDDDEDFVEPPRPEHAGQRFEPRDYELTETQLWLDEKRHKMQMKQTLKQFFSRRRYERKQQKKVVSKIEYEQDQTALRKKNTRQAVSQLKKNAFRYGPASANVKSGEKTKKQKGFTRQSARDHLFIRNAEMEILSTSARDKSTAPKSALEEALEEEQDEMDNFPGNSDSPLLLSSPSPSSSGGSDRGGSSSAGYFPGASSGTPKQRTSGSGSRKSGRALLVRNVSGTTDRSAGTSGGAASSSSVGGAGAGGLLQNDRSQGAGLFNKSNNEDSSATKMSSPKKPKLARIRSIISVEDGTAGGPDEEEEEDGARPSAQRRATVSPTSRSSPSINGTFTLSPNNTTGTSPTSHLNQRQSRAGANPTLLTSSSSNQLPRPRSRPSAKDQNEIDNGRKSRPSGYDAGGNRSSIFSPTSVKKTLSTPKKNYVAASKHNTSSSSQLIQKSVEKTLAAQERAFAANPDFQFQYTKMDLQLQNSLSPNRRATRRTTSNAGNLGGKNSTTLPATQKIFSSMNTDNHPPMIPSQDLASQIPARELMDQIHSRVAERYGGKLLLENRDAVTFHAGREADRTKTAAFSNRGVSNAEILLNPTKKPGLLLNDESSTAVVGGSGYFARKSNSAAPGTRDSSRKNPDLDDFGANKTTAFADWRLQSNGKARFLRKRAASMGSTVGAVTGFFGGSRESTSSRAYK